MTLIGSEIGQKRAEILFSALNGEPETSLRLNRRKLPEQPPYQFMQRVPWCESGFYLQHRPQFTFDPLLHAGAYYVQDASSMVYETIVRSIAGDQPVLACDLCASPGGKTTAMLNALPDGSVMLANEFHSQRANILKENLCKYGYPHLMVTNTDTSRLAALKGVFGIVAVDAPCSGEGMMRKDETARIQWSEGLIKQCAALQREILENAVGMLAPGGHLIYSTCTFNTVEDEDNAIWLTETFGLEPVDTGLAGTDGIQGQAKGRIPCLRFMPGFTRGEGLFLSVFRKPAGTGERHPLKVKKKGKADGKERINPQLMATAKSWIEGDFDITCHDGHLLAISPMCASLLYAMPKGVRVMSAGVEIGEIKGKDLVPSHQLAMSTAMAHPFPEVELSKEDALFYLAKEAITLPEMTPKGYVTATYQGHSLGFLKNLGNRSNNLYPPEYRIKNKTFMINHDETC